MTRGVKPACPIKCELLVIGLLFKWVNLCRYTEDRLTKRAAEAQKDKAVAEGAESLLR
jgi:hypothetical protein